MVALKNLKITIIEFIVMKNVNVLILRLYYIPIYLNLKFIIIIHDLTRYIFHITMYVYACSWLLTTVWMTCFDGFWASQQRKSVISVDGVVIHFTGIFQGDLYCIFGIACCYSQNCKNSVMTSDNNKTFLSRPLIMPKL